MPFYGEWGAGWIVPARSSSNSYYGHDCAILRMTAVVETGKAVTDPVMTKVT
jgi:hypothetical protein